MTISKHHTRQSTSTLLDTGGRYEKRVLSRRYRLQIIYAQLVDNAIPLARAFFLGYHCVSENINRFIIPINDY